MTKVPEIPDRTSSKGNKRMRLRSSLSSMNSGTSSYWATKAEMLRLELEEMEEREACRQVNQEYSNLSEENLSSHNKEFIKRRDVLEGLVMNALKRENGLEMGLENVAKCTDSEQAEKAFVQLLLLHFVKEPKSQRSRFRERINNYYGTIRFLDGDEDNPEYWCPVTQAWAPDTRKAAHIFPQRLRQEGMDITFGKSVPNEMYSARNGLMLENQIEKYFDLLQLAIVPCKDNVDEFELRVLDKGLLKMKHVESRCTFYDLHGRRLKFLNENRPRKRYLYFHWMICMAVASSKAINQARIKEERKLYEKFWGTPGRWVREEMVRGLVKHTGHDLPLDHTIPGEEVDVTGLVEKACSPRKRLEDEDDEDEDDEDEDGEHESDDD
ncbi:hypothetical protein OCU04_010140 [Sclerotinia nivalis]|uniref:HNH nuclease domain-containing protein n=1 Tax=Sclerotinia nivalis TaxID=352851 RepID=A0A9X0AHI3_9HELO|nr:hypothetical protein OCU04_010140 [Sclerotinia nivalis]